MPRFGWGSVLSPRCDCPFFCWKLVTWIRWGPTTRRAAAPYMERGQLLLECGFFFSLSLIPCPFILSSLSPGILRAFSFGYHNRYVEKIENGPRDLFSVDHHHVFFFSFWRLLPCGFSFFFLSLKILRKPRLHSRIYFPPKRIWPDSMC